MKKKIALFANGWGNDYLHQIVIGMLEPARKMKADIHVFVDFSIWAADYKTNVGEFNIFTLPDLKDFDGVVVLENSFNMQEEFEYIRDAIKKADIPTVGLECTSDLYSTLSTDSYAGMYDLTEHLIKKHQVKDVVYIGGPEGYPENVARLKAVKDALAASGLSLPDDHIIYADWAKNMAKDITKDWIKKRHNVPDAFICANDVMATGVCEGLTEHHYEIPNDVIVTGYDCTRHGIDNNPPLASVNQEWVSMGKEAFRLLAIQMDGDRHVRNSTLKSRFIPACSCGCYESRSEYLKNVNVNELVIPSRLDALDCDSHFRHIYLATRKSEDENDLHASLSNLFVTEHNMEGDDFSFYLDREFFHIKDNDVNLFELGYPDELLLICGLENGLPRERQLVKRKDALFYMGKQKREPMLFINSPIYSEGRSYGFAQLSCDINIVQSNYLYIWTRHLNQYLEQVRRNITISDLTRRLTELSVKDGLTGTFNRTGCGDVMFPKMEEWHKKGNNLVIMIADIDRMKNINDGYGHGAGDVALCTVARVMQKAIPADWMISRFGGDEFLIGGVITNEKQPEELVETIYRELELAKGLDHIKFPLSVSVGCDIIYASEENFDIGKHIQKADDSMYIWKSKHHASMDEEP